MISRLAPQGTEAISGGHGDYLWLFHSLHPGCWLVKDFADTADLRKIINHPQTSSYRHPGPPKLRFGMTGTPKIYDPNIQPHEVYSAIIPKRTQHLLTQCHLSQMALLRHQGWRFVTSGGMGENDRENMLAVVDCFRKLGDGLILFQITNLRTSLRKCMGIELCLLTYIDDIFWICRDTCNPSKVCLCSC